MENFNEDKRCWVQEDLLELYHKKGDDYVMKWLEGKFVFLYQNLRLSLSSEVAKNYLIVRVEKVMKNSGWCYKFTIRRLMRTRGFITIGKECTSTDREIYLLSDRYMNHMLIKDVNDAIVDIIRFNDDERIKYLKTFGTCVGKLREFIKDYDYDNGKVG